MKIACKQMLRDWTMSTLNSSSHMSSTADFPAFSEERLQKAVERIISVLHPEKVILFGSYAYGRPDPDSDVDILVVMETNERASERVKAVSRLLSPRPFPLDVIVRTPGEVERDLKRVDPFMRELLAKGRLLYERP
jgi:uncharacterized protein